MVAVDDISFDVHRGEVVSLLGPSGCGKTTTLRCIAGLELPDDGTVEIDGELVAGGGTFVPPEDRGLSMVFQQYALWPHMTVRQNVEYGLRVRKTEGSRMAEMTERALSTVQLWDQRERRIAQLSGGQQQRIALARALAFEPDVLLFDEPLSNLDAKLREEMRLELVELQREFGFAGLYVTHDQMEAISISDRIIIMNRGQIEQVGSPQEVWSEPATRFVARFIGETNEYTQAVFKGRHAVDIGGGLMLDVEGEGADPGTKTGVFIPYQAIDVVHGEGSDGPNCITARVALVNFQGFSTLIKAHCSAGEIIVRTPGTKSIAEGDEVALRILPEAIRYFPYPEF